MAQLALVIVPAKALKSGQHKVRIAVSHNSETRYIVTDVKIDSTRQFRNGAVTGRTDAGALNMKLRRLLNRYQDKLDSAEYIEGLSCAELVNVLKDNVGDKNITLGEAYAQMMRFSTARKSTVETMDVAFRSLSRFVGENTAVRSITKLTCMSYHKHLLGRKLKNSTVGNYMSFMFQILNFEKKMGVTDIDTHGLYKRVPAAARDSWLTVDEIRRIRDYDFGRKKNLSLARDLFMLSYYLGGINMTDMLDLTFDDSGIIKYHRKKMLGRNVGDVRYTMSREAAELVKRLPLKNGRIHLERRARSYSVYGISKIREMLGIPQLVFYSARKSFSQHAFELGVPTQVIDYILGHSMRLHGIIYHYVAVKPKMATEAIRKVIDNLNKKDGA